MRVSLIWGMKKVIVLLSLLFSLTSLSAAPRNVMEWLKGFEIETRAHDREAILRRMDPEYRKAQLEDMLEGNREQFLAEFYCGHALGSNNFDCPESIDAILMISFIGMKRDKALGGYEVTYHVKLGNGSLMEVKRLLRIRGKSILGWVGAMG